MNIRNTILLTVLLSLFSTSVTAKQEMDGNYLLKQCKAADIVINKEGPPPESNIEGDIDYAFAFGFCFSAVRTTIGVNTLFEDALDGAALFCMLEQTVQYSEIITYLIKWMERNQSKLEWNYDQVIVLALKDRYPCYKNLFEALSCKPQYDVSLTARIKRQGANDVWVK